MDLQNLFSTLSGHVGKTMGIHWEELENEPDADGFSLSVLRQKLCLDDENHPLLSELKQLAKDNGLSLRLLFQSGAVFRPAQEEQAQPPFLDLYAANNINYDNKFVIAPKITITLE